MGTKGQDWAKELAEGAAALGSLKGEDLRVGLGREVAMSSSKGGDFKCSAG